MWTLTGFADEISPELQEQLDTLESEGLRHLEFRAVWGKNVLDLSDEEVDRVAKGLGQRGVMVSSVGSPIGKIGINDDFDEHLKRFERALWCAKRLDAPYIRIFSFFVPKGEARSYRDEVLRRLRSLAERAEKEGIILLHENEKEIYGDVPERCLDIVESVGSPNLRLVWDPANFVQVGIKTPYDAGYEMLRPYIEYIHVKDALFENGQNVPAGEGDGQIPETVAALRDSGFDGFFSMEPHLQVAERFSGFSGPELFKKATQAFKAILKDAGVEWV
ncbi:MAG: sugar phosphate isomerase/epimerase [Firmicutes bacterium]|jgi:sugar phosphate isomerase/epimerase|nr:sugar phosphate isomerase/epimerase [Bacillota bacterium]